MCWVVGKSRVGGVVGESGDGGVVGEYSARRTNRCVLSLLLVSGQQLD